MVSSRCIELHMWLVSALGVHPLGMDNGAELVMSHRHTQAITRTCLGAAPNASSLMLRSQMAFRTDYDMASDAFSNLGRISGLVTLIVFVNGLTAAHLQPLTALVCPVPCKLVAVISCMLVDTQSHTMHTNTN